MWLTSKAFKSKKSTRPPTHPNPSPIPTRAPNSLPSRRSAGSTGAALCSREPALGEQLLPQARPAPALAAPPVARSGWPDMPCCTTAPAKPLPLPCDCGTPRVPEPLPRYATTARLPPLHPQAPSTAPLAPFPTPPSSTASAPSRLNAYSLGPLPYHPGCRGPLPSPPRGLARGEADGLPQPPARS